MDLRNAAIVVAHPDDEILWFSSLTKKVGRIVICYGPNPNVEARAEQRRRVIRSYPYDTVRFLDLPEPGLWKGRSLGTAASESARSSEEDPALRNALCGPVCEAVRGATTVFVHNSWGEYGHDDHRRVHAVVAALRREMNYAVWVSTYVERRALHLMGPALDAGIAETVSFPVDRTEIDPIYELYKLNSCWTWSTDWRWPAEEHFLRLGESAALRSVPIPFHLFYA